jgi:hypothetical protein
MGTLIAERPPWDQWVPPEVIEEILPVLADSATVDWSKPLSTWSREEMVKFLDLVLGLVRQAMAARTAAIPFNDPIPF